MSDPSVRDSTITLILSLEHDRSAYTRGCAAQALGKAREKTALPALRQALSDTSSWVRGWAAYGLGRLQDEYSLSDLCGLLGDEDYWVRQQAADTLVGFDSHLADNTLLLSLKQKNPTARAWSLHVIAERGQVDAALDVVPILEDDDRSVRLSAVRTLYRLGKSSAILPVQMFIRDPDVDLRGAAVYAIGALGDKDSVSTLCGALTDSAAWVRRNAAWSLLVMGEALNLVADMNQDQDTGVRSFAARARQRLEVGNGPDRS